MHTKEMVVMAGVSIETRPVDWLLNSSIQSFGTFANLLPSSEWDTTLPDLLLPRRWVEHPGFNYRVQL